MTDANFHLKVNKKNVVIGNLVLMQKGRQKLIKKSLILTLVSRIKVNFAGLHSLFRGYSSNNNVLFTFQMCRHSSEAQTCNLFCKRKILPDKSVPTGSLLLCICLGNHVNQQLFENSTAAAWMEAPTVPKASQTRAEKAFFFFQISQWEECLITCQVSLNENQPGDKTVGHF